jgi:hypothetical protein
MWFHEFEDEINHRGQIRWLRKRIQKKLLLSTHYEPDIVDLILKELKITDRSEMETLSVDLKDIKAITETKYIFLN